MGSSESRCCAEDTDAAKDKKSPRTPQETAGNSLAVEEMGRASTEGISALTSGANKPGPEGPNEHIPFPNVAHMTAIQDPRSPSQGIMRTPLLCSEETQKEETNAPINKSTGGLHETPKKPPRSRLNPQNPETPKGASMGFCDPRSPSSGISRTPLAKNTETPKENLISMCDPRSPTSGISRTPMAKSETPQPSTGNGQTSYAARNLHDPRSPTTDVSRTPMGVLFGHSNLRRTVLMTNALMASPTSKKNANGAHEKPSTDAADLDGGEKSIKDIESDVPGGLDCSTGFLNMSCSSSMIASIGSDVGDISVQSDKSFDDSITDMLPINGDENKTDKDIDVEIFTDARDEIISEHEPIEADIEREFVHIDMEMISPDNLHGVNAKSRELVKPASQAQNLSAEGHDASNESLQASPGGNVEAANVDYHDATKETSQTRAEVSNAEVDHFIPQETDNKASLTQNDALVIPDILKNTSHDYCRIESLKDMDAQKGLEDVEFAESAEKTAHQGEESTAQDDAHLVSVSEENEANVLDDYRDEDVAGDEDHVSARKQESEGATCIPINPSFPPTTTNAEEAPGNLDLDGRPDAIAVQDTVHSTDEAVAPSVEELYPEEDGECNAQNVPVGSQEVLGACANKPDDTVSHSSIKNAAEGEKDVQMPEGSTLPLSLIEVVSEGEKDEQTLEIGAMPSPPIENMHDAEAERCNDEIQMGRVEEEVEKSVEDLHPAMIEDGENNARSSVIEKSDIGDLKDIEKDTSECGEPSVLTSEAISTSGPVVIESLGAFATTVEVGNTEKAVEEESHLGDTCVTYGTNVTGSYVTSVTGSSVTSVTDISYNDDLSSISTSQQEQSEALSASLPTILNPAVPTETSETKDSALVKKQARSLRRPMAVTQRRRLSAEAKQPLMPREPHGNCDALAKTESNLTKNDRNAENVKDIKKRSRMKAPKKISMDGKRSSSATRAPLAVLANENSPSALDDGKFIMRQSPSKARSRSTKLPRYQGTPPIVKNRSLSVSFSEQPSEPPRSVDKARNMGRSFSHDKEN